MYAYESIYADSMGNYAIHPELKRLSYLKYPLSSALALLSHGMKPVTAMTAPLPGIKEERRTIAGIKCIVLHPGKSNGTLLDIHGGAFAFPAAPYMKKIASLYALTGYDVVMPDYPLLPFHHYPEPIDALSELALKLDTLTVITGDSAGGFLAAATASAISKPLSLMLIYPVVFPSAPTPSMQRFCDTPVWDGRKNEWMAKKYLKGQLPNPFDFRSIKSAFIEVTEYDPLHDEGVMIYEILKSICPAVLSETKGTVHGYDALWKQSYARSLIEKRLEWLNMGLLHE